MNLRFVMVLLTEPDLYRWGRENATNAGYSFTSKTIKRLQEHSILNLIFLNWSPIYLDVKVGRFNWAFYHFCFYFFAFFKYLALYKLNRLNYDKPDVKNLKRAFMYFYPFRCSFLYFDVACSVLYFCLAVYIRYIIDYVYCLKKSLLKMKRVT